MESFKIVSKNNNTIELRNLISTINDYIENSSDTGIEFSAIDDLIESNSEMYEDEVSSSLFTPMYIGLMGTFIGIIFGVLSIAFSGNSSNWDQKIYELLYGVGIAMTVSLLGLLLSVLNSNILYPGAKVKFDKGKIRFKNFIRTRLIPLNIKNDHSSIASLNRTIGSFSQSFDKKLNKLGNYLESNIDSFKMQEELLNKFENINIKQVTNANLTLFNKFSESAEKLEALNKSLENVNVFVKESSTLSQEANRLFGRFKNFEANSEKIANEIDNKLSLSNELLSFLKAHFEELDKISNYTIKAVGDVDEKVGYAINELGNNISKKQQIFADAIGNIDTEIAEAFGQLKEHLRTILSTLIEETDSQANFIGNAHKEAVRKYDESLDKLSESINEKIKKIEEIINSDALNVKKVVDNNKALFNNLEQLNPIKTEIYSINEKFQELATPARNIPSILGDINESLKKNRSNSKPSRGGKKEKKTGFIRRIFRFSKN